MVVNPVVRHSGRWAFCRSKTQDRSFYIGALLLGEGREGRERMGGQGREERGGDRMGKEGWERSTRKGRKIEGKGEGEREEGKKRRT